MKRLAIIIPAYKATFLPAALDSIAAQTSQDFTLYVGDDCSPEPISEIVEQYRDKIDLVYQRFDSNLGGRDLVAQWERCIAMSKDEPYIWLFSDDDVMEPNCVEALLRQIEATDGAYDLYHFDVNEINEKGEVTKHLPEYPQVLSAYDFYKGKTSGRYRSYVVENVFSRKAYQQAGGFKNFDLAWSSDVATWCILSKEKGMCRISEAKVCWRRSSQNITPDKSRHISERKLMARCESLAWAYNFFNSEPDIWTINSNSFISVMRHYKPYISKECLNMAYQHFFGTHGHRDKMMQVKLNILLPERIYKIINHFIKL
ncbi:MAG: glycosyltransferase [Prevotella sp.]|nr:glycosyltransferase [Prevotella sp.]